MGDEIALHGDCGEVSLANGCCRQVDEDVAVRRAAMMDCGLSPIPPTARSM